MKASIFALCILVCMAAAPSLAERPTRSPLFGTWAVDVTRLPIPAEARPRSVTITFSEADSGGVATAVDVIDASGKPMHAQGTTALDGTPAPVQGNLEADDSATTMPARDVLVMQLAKDGVPASTRIYVASRDGASMVETAAYVGSDGRPVLRTNYFRRVDERGAEGSR